MSKFTLNPDRAALVAALALAATTVLSLPTTASAQSTSAANAQMPASTRLALPAAPHRWLEPLAGSWNVEMKVFTGTGQPPITSNALTATREWILGGRYLREDLQGVFAGNPSARQATIGFNNLDQRWELMTVDTFEPGQMWYAGEAQGTAQRFELRGESTEAGFGPSPTGRKRHLRFEFEILGADRNVQRIFLKYPGEQEQLFVEQVFTRRQ